MWTTFGEAEIGLGLVQQPPMRLLEEWIHVHQTPTVLGYGHGFDVVFRFGTRVRKKKGTNGFFRSIALGRHRRLLVTVARSSRMIRFPQFRHGVPRRAESEARTYVA